MKKDSILQRKEFIAIINFIPLILFSLLLIFITVGSFVSGDAKSVINAIADVSLYVCAGVSLLAAAAACMLDVIKLIRGGSKKNIWYIVLTVMSTLIWVFLLELNEAFSA